MTKVGSILEWDEILFLDQKFKNLLLKFLNFWLRNKISSHSNNELTLGIQTLYKQFIVHSIDFEGHF